MSSSRKAARRSRSHRSRPSRSSSRRSGRVWLTWEHPEESYQRDELARQRGGYGAGWYAVYYRKKKGDRAWTMAKGFEGPYLTKKEAEQAANALGAYPRVEVIRLSNDPWTLQDAGRLPARLAV
jgi:hypothetical protein